MARLIAPRMAESLGQPVVVENKPGAGVRSQARTSPRAAADGATLLFDASSYAVAPSLYPPHGVRPGQGLHADRRAGTVSQRARRAPAVRGRQRARCGRRCQGQAGALAYASSGNGSAQHLAGALFEDLAKVDLLHVPYTAAAARP
jgi:tripartite-type tricarboxylate transporter receptor subunit TctC